MSIRNLISSFNKSKILENAKDSLKLAIKMAGIKNQKVLSELKYIYYPPTISGPTGHSSSDGTNAAVIVLSIIGAGFVIFIVVFMIYSVKNQRKSGKSGISFQNSMNFCDCFKFLFI